MITATAVRIIPYGTPAYRTNLCAGLFSALGNAVLYLFVERVTGSVPASALAAFGFAFGKLVWLYSIQAEVFALNNFLAAMLLYLTARYEAEKSLTVALLGAFTCGLGISNQHTIVFYIVPCVLQVLWSGKETLLTFGAFSKLVAAGLLGLAPYAYLPLAAPLALPGSWGSFDTWEGFFTHFLRKEYGTFRLFSGAEQDESHFLLGLQHYMLSLLEDSRIVGVLLLVVGVVAVIRNDKKMNPGGRICLVVFVSYTLAFNKMANLQLLANPLHLGVMARFWLQSHLAAFALMGMGASYLLSLLPQKGVNAPPLPQSANLKERNAHAESLRKKNDEVPTTPYRPTKHLIDPPNT
jgi:hypothetical protein